MEILDTAGQDAYTPLRETFMHTGDGFLLVYSIVDDQTLEELRDIREQILRVHPDKKVSNPSLFTCILSITVDVYLTSYLLIGSNDGYWE